MSSLAELAAAFTRGWVRVYTRGLPREIGQQRSLEVAADLWDHQQDARTSGAASPAIALEIFGRAILGIPDDLGWRRETILAWRASHATRRPMMKISIGRMRGMGVAAVTGGVLWTGGAFIPNEWRAFEVAYVIGSMLLCLLGVFGFYVQKRPGAGRLGAIGLTMLLAGFLFSLVAASVAELVSESHPVAGIFGILAWPLMIPLGFLFVGLGVPIRFRWVVLAVGTLLMLRWLPQVKTILPDVLFSSVGTGALWAIGLAVIGYSVVSGTRAERSLNVGI
jgi:hypothetical protein